MGKVFTLILLLCSIYQQNTVNCRTFLVETEDGGGSAGLDTARRRRTDEGHEKTDKGSDYMQMQAQQQNGGGHQMQSQQQNGGWGGAQQQAQQQNGGGWGGFGQQMQQQQQNAL